MARSTRVFVTHRFAGFHAWPLAPAHRDYLRDRHRHLFHVRVSADVGHADREVEFHDLLDCVRGACSRLGAGIDDGRELGAMSCEQIAERIIRAVDDRWPSRAVVCEVSEDGENGAVVER